MFKFKKKRKKKEKIETSKKALAVTFIISIEILLYVEVMCFVLRDTSSLYALISVPVALVPVVLGYMFKSKAQNTAGGITYDLAMLQAQQGEQNQENMDDEVLG